MATTPLARRGTSRGTVSCEACLGWGQTYTAALCLSCSKFPTLNPETGPCGACHHVLPLKKGSCRLCWHQAEHDRQQLAADARSKVMLAPWLPKITHQQLFLLWNPART